LRAEKFVAFDGADDETGEIVFARLVKVGHLGGFLRRRARSPLRGRRG